MEERMMSKNYLWKFHWDCGRSGDLEGLFVATEEEIEKAIGGYAQFGEVLGKHSDIYGTLDREDVEKIDVAPEIIAQLIPHLGYDWSGFNPLDYIRDTTECQECGEEMYDDEWNVEYREEFDKEMCYECYQERLNEDE